MIKYIIIGLILLAGASYQSWVLYEANAQIADDKFYLDRAMHERDDLEVQLRDMTYQAHPFTKTGQVGPTASKELQCMQLLGLIKKLPPGPLAPPPNDTQPPIENH